MPARDLGIEPGCLSVSFGLLGLRLLLLLDHLRLVMGILGLIEDGTPRVRLVCKIGPHLSQGDVLGV
jgi:hypothetical protein